MLAGEGRENVWQPVLAEIEDALVPAFIIEEVEDGRFTIFVPSIPTPLAGAVYVLGRPGASLGRALHAGDPDRLAVGVRVKRAGGGDAQARPRPSRRCDKQVTA